MKKKTSATLTRRPKSVRIAIYPGTFDPITSGHLDVLARACRIFDRVIVAVADNPDKNPLFSIKERLQLIEENLKPYPKAKTTSFKNLTVDFASSVKAVAIIRGLRAISDFEYEFQMAQINRSLDSEIETVFLMPNEKYFFTSSSLIKQVSRFSDKTKKFVPANVYRALKKQFQKFRDH